MIDFGESFTSYNPADGSTVWQGQASSKEDLDHVIEQAKEAFQKWTRFSFEQRLECVEKFASLVKLKREELAALISQEMGKVSWEAKMEIGAMINKVQISVEAYKERCADKDFDNSQIRYKAHGVLAVFGPFNFPGHLPNGHIVPALLAGNTVIFKPSELTPKFGEEMIKLWHQSGIPVGTISLVQGSAAVGKAMVEHKDIDGILFTGSSETGLAIHEALATKPQKILALEMGGNNPLVVEAVNNIDAAVYLTIQSAFITSGQRCTCARRLIVSEGSEGDKFISRLQEISAKIKIGSYKSDNVFMGPLASAQQAEKVLQAQTELIEKGAQPLLEVQRNYLGQANDAEARARTAFLSPGLIDCTGINRDDKEIFGPLLQIFRVKDFAAAIEEANNSRYGLSAGLISEDPELYEKFFHEVKAGLINWNQQLTGASSKAPFGGVGLSGNHRPSAYLAADYCSYPVSSLVSPELKLSDELSPGISFS